MYQGQEARPFNIQQDRRYLALFSRVFRLKTGEAPISISDSSSADCFLFFSSLLFLAFFSRYSWFSAGWCFWRWVSMEVVLSLPLGFSGPPLFTSLSGQLAIWQRTIDPLAGVLASRKLSQIGESLVLMSGIRFSFNDKILSGGEGAGVQPPSAVLTNHNLRNQILKLTSFLTQHLTCITKHINSRLLLTGLDTSIIAFKIWKDMISSTDIINVSHQSTKLSSLFPVQ